MVEGVDNGYAAKAAIPGIKVGGKTGTAEVGDGTSHSWFIGFAPADSPRIAIAVIMEHQGSGSDFATPGRAAGDAGGVSRLPMNSESVRQLWRRFSWRRRSTARLIVTRTRNVSGALCSWQRTRTRRRNDSSN